jgi:hypothetical protein
MSVVDHRFVPRLGGEADSSLPRMLRSQHGAASTTAPPSRVMFHLGQVFRGFAIGAIVVAPTVVWLSGALDARPGTSGIRPPAVVVSQVSSRPVSPSTTDQMSLSAATPAVPAIVTMAAPTEPPVPPAPTSPPVVPVQPASIAAAPVVLASPPDLQSVKPSPATPTNVAPAATVIEAPPAVSAENVVADLLEEARALVLAGRVVDARELLTQPEMRASAEAMYVLAETYDPNVLAALSITQVRAEPMRARALYEQALGEGLTAARQRLRALD